jgi:hypothetical protein
MSVDKKKLGVGLALAAALTVAGCYKHSFNVGSGGNLNADAKYSSWESHWFFGIIGESNVDVKQVCPSGNATLKDRVSFLNGLIGSIIGIIWYPSTVEVYCGAEAPAAAAPAAAPAAAEPAAEPAKTSRLELTPEQMRQIALNPKTLEWAMTVSPTKAADLQAAIEVYKNRTQNIAKGRSTTFAF